MVDETKEAMKEYDYKCKVYEGSEREESISSIS